jgi:hypothetical protein
LDGDRGTALQGDSRQGLKSLGCSADTQQWNCVRAGERLEHALITHASVFLKAKHDDMVDSMTMVPKYLRDVGMAQNEQVHAEPNERAKPRSKPKALHSC